MSFSAYPAYKESGVKWLPEVPEHWEVRRNKQAFRIVSTLVGSKSKDFQLLSLTLRGVIPRDIESGKGKFPAEFNTYQTVEPDDIVFCLFDIDETPRTVGISSDYGMITGAYTVARAFAAADPRFIYYYYFAIDLRKGLRPFYTGLRKVVRPETFMNIELSLPPRSEQINICNFLDHETARIDALIEEQQRLIELLKEKRQAVISHAVTKGLDPTVPMKDSGVEWLDEVPAHWDVVPTNYRYEIQLGRMLNEQRAQGDHLKRYLRVFDVQWNAINTTNLPLMDFPPEVQPMYRLKSGDLMVNEGGSYVGRSAIWRAELDECYYQKALHRLRPRDVKSDTAEFFLYVMEMATQQGVFVAGGNQTTIDHLTAEQLRQYRFAFPPLKEQLQIAEKITAVVSIIQNTTSEAQQLIGYLQERRSALISAAVTGKIDVRGWQPPANVPSSELAQEAM